MSNTKNCHHRFVYIKSDNSYLIFQCSCCLLSHLYAIFECQLCKLKVCGPCMNAL